MNGDLSSNPRQLGRATEPSAAATLTGNRKAIGRSNATSGGMPIHQGLPNRRHGYPDYSNQLSATRLPMISPISTTVSGLASSASTLMSGTGHRSTSGESHSSRMMPPPQLSTPQSSVTSQQQQRTGYGSSVSGNCGQGPMSNTRGLTSCGFSFKTENETMGVTKPIVTQPPHGISPSSLLPQHQKHSMNGLNDHVITVTDSSHRRLSGGVQPEVGFGDMEGAETGLLDTKADGPWSLVGSQPALPSSTTTQSASRMFNNVTRCADHQQFPHQSTIFVVPPRQPAPPRSAAMTSIYGPGASPIQSARGGGKKRAMSSSTRSSDAPCDVLSITRMSPTALIWGDDYSETQNHYQHQQQYQHGTTRCCNGFLSGSGEVGHNIMSARGSVFSESSLASASANSRQRVSRQVISSVGGSVRRGQRPGNSSSFGGGEDDDESYSSIIDSMMFLERGGLERGGRYDEMQQPIALETAPSNRIVFRSSVKLCGGGQVTINKTPYADEFSEFADERIDGYRHRRLPPPYDAACGASRTGDMLSAVDSTFDDEQFPDIEQQYSQLDQLSNEFGSATWTEDSASTSSGYHPQCVCKWRDCDQLFHCQDELVQHLEREHVDQRSAAIATGVTTASGAVGDEFTCMWDGCKRQTKPFNARYKLLIHLRVHSGEKPHRCTADGCDKSFSRLENLKIHMRSHTGERPYICSHVGCNKAFSNSSDRAKHQRTHVDTKPYACQVPNCDKRYTDPSSLRKHLKIHTAGGLQHLKKKVRTDSSDDCSTPTSAAGGASSTDTATLNNLLSISVVPRDLTTCTQQQHQPYPTGLLFGQAMLDGFSSQATSTHSSDLQNTSNKHHPSLPVSMGLTEHRQIVGGGFNSQSNGSLLTAAKHRPLGSSHPNLTVSGTGRSPPLGPAVQVRKIRQNVPPPPYPSATTAEPENDQMWINNVAQQNSGITDQRSPANSESSSSNAASNFQPGTSSTPGVEFGQGEYPKFPVYGSTSIRYIEQLYANDPPAFVPSSASSSVPTLPPLRRTSSCLQPPAYYQPMHQFAEYMPCNMQQRMAYGSGAFNSTGGTTSLYPQLLPDSLEQTLAGLPSDAIQLNDFADYQGFTDFTASTVQEQDYLTVYNG